MYPLKISFSLYPRILNKLVGIPMDTSSFVTEVVGFSFLSSNVLKIWQTAVVIL